MATAWGQAVSRRRADPDGTAHAPSVRRTPCARSQAHTHPEGRTAAALSSPADSPELADSLNVPDGTPLAVVPGLAAVVVAGVPVGAVVGIVVARRAVCHRGP